MHSPLEIRSFFWGTGGRRNIAAAFFQKVANQPAQFAFNILSRFRGQLFCYGIEIALNQFMLHRMYPPKVHYC